MPFLGCAIAGTQFSDPLINQTEYSQMEVKNAIVDDFYISSSIENIKTSIPTEWDFDTIANAKYENGISAGNLAYGVDHVSSIIIKRREKDSLKWLTLGDVSVAAPEDFIFVFYDRTARCGVEYEYALVPVVDGFESSMLISTITPRFKGLFIIDRNAGYVSHTDIGVDITRKQAGQTVPLYGSRYPYYVRNGYLNYDTGSVTATFIPFDDASCQFILDNAQDYAKEVVEFLSDGNIKAIKHQDGRMWVVQIVGDISTTTSANTQVSTISFSFEQIGSNDDETLLKNSSLLTLSTGDVTK